MGEMKICPILMLVKALTKENAYPVNCRGEACAWFDETKCGIIR